QGVGTRRRHPGPRPPRRCESGPRPGTVAGFKELRNNRITEQETPGGRKSPGAARAGDDRGPSVLGGSRPPFTFQPDREILGGRAEVWGSEQSQAGRATAIPPMMVIHFQAINSAINNFYYAGALVRLSSPNPPAVVKRQPCSGAPPTLPHQSAVATGQ